MSYLAEVNGIRWAFSWGYLWNEQKRTRIHPCQTSSVTWRKHALTSFQYDANQQTLLGKYIKRGSRIVY
ncbi:hypothetical protein DL897_01515 [Thermoflavimicrobium daqui]|uniref:Uncharacterized protein n=1 Tax=Thermoflavimicrobium daqui TaxID=2137476 RepID=A0A364K8Z7_9BACL|nr:hypothetical protein DL897_01515 [Thermoflavimicrobium daqui]